MKNDIIEIENHYYGTVVWGKNSKTVVDIEVEKQIDVENNVG